MTWSAARRSESGSLICRRPRAAGSNKLATPSDDPSPSPLCVWPEPGQSPLPTGRTATVLPTVNAAAGLPQVPVSSDLPRPGFVQGET